MLRNGHRRCPVNVVVCDNFFENDDMFCLKVVDGFMQKARAKADGGDAAAGMIGQLKLEEFAGVLDNAPPGTDELVALSKVCVACNTSVFSFCSAPVRGYVCFLCSQQRHQSERLQATIRHAICFDVD